MKELTWNESGEEARGGPQDEQTENAGMKHHQGQAAANSLRTIWVILTFMDIGIRIRILNNSDNELYGFMPCQPVLGIRDILVRIQIAGSVPMANGPGSGSGSRIQIQLRIRLLSSMSLRCKKIIFSHIFFL